MPLSQVGEFLCRHPAVVSIHLTGSAATYNSIVWDSSEGPSSGSAEPRLKKEVTAELSNVTPYIVVPGKWSRGDLEHHADNIISGASWYL